MKVLSSTIAFAIGTILFDHFSGGIDKETARVVFIQVVSCLYIGYSTKI